MTEAIPRQTLPEACAARLREMILRGEFQPGERLPPERPLAEQFDVNRVTLRSALSRLTDSGLLEVRQGRGYVVADYRVSGGPDLLPGLFSLAQDEAGLAELASDLFLVRRQLARAVLERICERRPSTEGIEAAIARFEEVAATGADTTTLAEADAEILVALLDTTGSAVFQLSLNPVRAVLRDLPQLTASMYRSPQANVALWRGLVSWMQDPDPSGIDAFLGFLKIRDADTVASLGRPR